MFEKKRAPWRRLDNAAKIFPATSGEKDTRVFRFYCELKEEVQEELLQKALDKTIEKYPIFLSVMRKGLFWHYLEQSKLRPVVEEEYKEPCSDIYVRDKKSLLFEVTYYKKRINFEVYHSLTDGTGATLFLRELVKNYLVLVHGAEGLQEISLGNEMLTVEDQEDDGFDKYYVPGRKRQKKEKEKAYQLKRRKNDAAQLKVLEATLSVTEVLEKSREYSVSMTVLLTAVLLCAIQAEMTRSQKKNPVILMIPVNLRKLFPSESMLNFFGWIEPSYRFGQGKDSFEDVLEYVKTFFKEELTQERMEEHMNEWMSLERNPVLRLAPLELKNVCMNAGAKLASKELTAILSNMSVVKMPKEYEEYIERFGVYTSTTKLELCVCSFKDKLSLGFTSRCDTQNILRNYFRILSDIGISSNIEQPEYPEERKQSRRAKKVFQWFTFLCIASIVIAVGANTIFSPERYWSVVVAGGVLSAWIFLAIGFRKRHNLLKNEMWELLFVTVGCILWDVSMKWRGWSVNYVLPVATMLTLNSMLVIIKAQKLMVKEYMIYLLMAGAYGTVVPFILLLTKAVSVGIPSKLCVIVSFLILTALVIFKKKEVVQELHKKFHI